MFTPTTDTTDTTDTTNITTPPSKFVFQLTKVALAPTEIRFCIARNSFVLYHQVRFFFFFFFTISNEQQHLLRR